MAENSNLVRCADCALLFLQPTARRQTRTARVEELLQKNLPPLDVELSVFRSDQASASAALQDLDAKIAQAKELLDNLHSAREQAQSHLEDAKSLLHPMRAIPSELLLEVFSHCMPRVEDSVDTDSLHPQRAPWLLTRVCHRWRELVINSPRLWTQLLIDFDEPTGCDTDPLCTYRAKLFIERSKGLPMTVFLGSTAVISERWLTVLEKGIPRFEYLHADVPHPSLQCLFERVFSGLQTLVLLDNRWGHPDDGTIEPLKAPVLRKLAVLSNEFWEDSESDALPWSQLTSVGNFLAFDIEGLNNLRMMTNLEDLSVLVDGSDLYTPIRDIITLPNLRRLTIVESNNTAGRGQEFFTALQIPALVDLVLGFPNGDVTIFPIMASTSPLSNLTKLDISCNMNAYGENIKHLLDFLALTQRVEWLRIRDRSMIVEFANGLNVSGGGLVRLPGLLFLDIGDCKCAGALFDDIKPIVDMLCSRLPRDATEEGEGADSVCQQNLITTGVVAVSARFLQTVHLPRPVYVNMRNHWSHTFSEMSRKVKLVCGVA